MHNWGVLKTYFRVCMLCIWYSGFVFMDQGKVLWKLFINALWSIVTLISELESFKNQIHSLSFCFLDPIENKPPLVGELGLIMLSIQVLSALVSLWPSMNGDTLCFCKVTLCNLSVINCFYFAVIYFVFLVDIGEKEETKTNKKQTIKISKLSINKTKQTPALNPKSVYSYFHKIEYLNTKRAPAQFQMNYKELGPF